MNYDPMKSPGATRKATLDLKRRLLAAQFESLRLQYRAIIHDQSLPYHLRAAFTAKLAALPRNSSKTRIRNRCIITGRPRAVLRKFRISRIVFREFAWLLAGVKKASW